MDYSKLSDATLKALKEGKTLDYSKLSDDELNELKGAAKPEHAEPVSKTESFLRGIGQGASLGFADELTGAIESLVTDKTYDQARDESRANYRSAEEENPLTFLGGNIAGGVLTPIPGMGAAKGIGQVALKGAQLGAVGGLGASEKDITNPDILKDIAMGAGLGGTLAGGTAAIGKGISALGGTTIGKSFKEGLKGNILVGKGNRQKIGDELVQFAGETGEGIQKSLKDEAANKMGILKDAEAGGQKLDVTDLLNRLYPEEKAQLPKSYTSEGDAARRKLDEPFKRAMGKAEEGASVDDDLSKLMSETFAEKGPAVPHIEQKFEMTPTEIDSFRRGLANLGYEADLKDSQVVALAKRMAGKASTKANAEIEGLGPSNEKIQNLIEAQDIFNIGSGLDELGNQKQLTPLLQRLESDSVSSDVARSKFDKGITALKQAEPEMGTNVENRARELAERYDIARDINKPITISREGAKRALTIGANPLGYAAGKIADTIPGKIVSRTVNATPEFMNSMATKLEAKGSKFGPVLRKLAAESDQKRKAMMFSLMQQPAFREAINTEPGDE